MVEDGEQNLGRNFDAFYFIGPRDMTGFFTSSGDSTLTAGIEVYFARKFASDFTLRDAFSVPGIEWGHLPPDAQGLKHRAAWTIKRKEFLRFYGLRASANFSLGSHDEMGHPAARQQRAPQAHRRSR